MYIDGSDLLSTTIRFGCGVLSEIPEDLDALRTRRPLVVTDKGVVAAGLIERLFGVMPAECRNSFSTMFRPIRPKRPLCAALSRYRDHNCDGLIGLGGGSPIDLAKAVALLATHPEPLAQYAAIEGGLGRITDRVAPVIAIPTTAGTGSRGRARRSDQPGRWAQARPHQPAPDPKARHLRSRPDTGASSAPHSRDRDGRALALY